MTPARKPAPWILKAARILARVSAVVCALGVVGALALWLAVAHGDLVDPARFARPDDAITILDRHGRPLRHVRDHGVDRRWVALHDISPLLISAVLATEDAGFHRHHGVDWRAVGRASLTNLLPWRRRSGASTLTQQLVKLVYGRGWGLPGKGLEALRALALERVFTKDEILEQYLNRLPFGDGIEGVARASEEYLGHPVSSLTPGEAALLAGIPQAPSLTEPRRHLARALARRAVVLRRLRATGLLDDEAVQAALHEVVRIQQVPAHPYEAPRFAEALLAAWRAGTLERHGGTLAGSLDLELQRRVESVLSGTVDRLDARGVHNGAAIVVANATGEVLAYVGAARRGAEAPGGQLDLLQARRQPGSTLKPLIYELFFERGGTPATVLDDVSVAMRGARGSSFEARDYDGHERGPVRARVALASSLNLAALDVARRVGQDAIVTRLRALGVQDLDAPGRYGAAVVLGGADVTAVELAGAYVTLARGGTRIPWSLVPVEPRAGTRVMAPAAARLAWDVVSDEHARRDAFGADLVDAAGGLHFALKTGTSSGWHDAWAAVATTSLTVVVWLGDPSGRPMAAVSGFEAAAPAAARILALAHAREAADDVRAVVVPAVDLVEAEVCAWSGLRAGPRCRHRVHERFAPASVPRAQCTAHDARGADLLPARYAAWAARTRPAGVAVGDATPSPADPAPRIVLPRAGARWLIDPQRAPASVPLRAMVGGVEAGQVTWEVDGARLADAHWRLVPGRHRFVAMRSGHRSPPVDVQVDVAR